MARADRHREGLRLFETVLVADRGLLAVRVIRCCQLLGIKVVTGATEGDENALHARLADEVVPLGQAVEPQSPAGLLEAARVTGAQAIHPGGGAWATDAVLADAVLAAGLAWVGPNPSGKHAERPAWRESVRRGGRTVLCELGEGDLDANAGLPALVGADRLVEAVTGIDLVHRQLRRAAGERLDAAPAGSGYAIQATVYAGAQTLVPVAVRGWVAPDGEGIVTDSVLADGAWLTRYDDPVVALVTAHGRDRAQALARLSGAVDAMAVTAPPVDVAALRSLLREPVVVSMVG